MASMATLVIDNSSSSQSNLARKPSQLHQSCDSYPSGTASSRAINNTGDDHLRDFVTSSHKSIYPLSSVIMSSEKPTNISSTNGYTTQLPSSQTTSQTGDSFGHYISETSKSKISTIVSQVEQLNDIEKLYLYLQLPDGTSNNNENINNDKKKIIYNPFGKKTDTEVIQTYTWIQSHLEEDISVSIPKHEVYEDYRTYCEANKFDKLCVADFGKAMKHIFPHVKPRRLGQRGNSKYCYSGLRKKILVEKPELPVLDTSEYKFGNEERESKKNVLADDVAWNVILDWAEKAFNRKYKSSIDFARYLIETENFDFSKVLKNSDSKVHSQFIKTCMSKTSTAKKKDTLNQISKKLQKKCDTEKTEKPFPSNNISRAKQANSVCPKTSDFSKVDNLNENLNIAPVTVKTESDDTAFSTPSSRIQLSNNNSYSNSPSSVNQLQVETQVATNQSLSNSSNISNLHTCSPTELNHTVCVAANSSTIKYKPIQPKLSNQESMSHCYQESENEYFNPQHNASNNIDKRRHSVAAPFTGDLNNKKEVDLSSFGAELRIENDKNYKRQMEEKEFQFMSKKRHISSDKLVCNPTVESSDLKVNEIETEALYDYLNTNTATNSAVYDISNSNNNSNDTSSLSNNSTINDGHKDSFVQIRKLLENNLPNSGGNVNSTNDNTETLIKPTLNNDQMPNAYIDYNKSSSLYPMPNNTNQFQFNESISGHSKEIIPNLNGISHINCSNNVNNNNNANSQAQIPPSPNARRRAFSFQPISPRNTPTIPENSALEMNMFNNKTGNFNGNFAVTHMKQMNTVAVGPSQPSSENNSPFISPRNTPIHMSSNSRSRNNSGQSSYSLPNYRQTSLPNFDSGVSSISSSPFISPQSTPIPGTARIRPIDNSNRNLARVRHSSGPGGPISRSQVANVIIYNRSNSLSPMISENAFVLNPNFNSTQNISSNVGLNNTKLFNEDLMNRLNMVSQTENKQQLICEPSHVQFNPTFIDNNNLQKSLNTRQRHFSTPYGGAANNNAQMKSEESYSFKMLINRSQSVPLSEMFNSNQFDIASIDQAFNNYPLLDGSNEHGGSISGIDPTLSKSYPSTPLCNDSFKLPQTTSIGTLTSAAGHNAGLESNGFLSGPSLDDLLTSNDSVIQSGQDVFVSSVQLNHGINSGSNDVTSSVDDLNVPSPLMLVAKSDRDGLNDLLISDNVVDDNFQSLGEFRDCDNDFSNLELDNQANSYDDVFKFG